MNTLIPQLNTDLTVPLSQLQQQFLRQQKEIDSWFHQQWQLTRPPVYGSVDLRNAGFKLAPIDMNLFPAGFNNLNPNFIPLSIKAARKIIELIVPGSKKVLIIPENHTRNLGYWQNIKTLQEILIAAEYEVRLGILSTERKIAQEISANNIPGLRVENLLRKGDQLTLPDFVPDLILLNNDLSSGIPDLLQNVSQPLVPPASLGWSQRLKSGHFQYYEDVTFEFADRFSIDSWLIAPLFRHCGKIDFMQQTGMDCVIHNAEILFSEIKKKYEEYHIPHQPFLVVKADAGTYGMAVMTVRDPNELKHLNRKQRTRMASTKGGQPVRKVIIQEGVYSFETFGAEAVAEPVVYLWGDVVVGGFYRIHKNRGVDENLNAPGMHFEPIAFTQTCDQPDRTQDFNACQNRFYLYGIVAQLSMLAAAREIKDQQRA